jgi:hypothetical protein
MTAVVGNYGQQGSVESGKIKRSFPATADGSDGFSFKPRRAPIVLRKFQHTHFSRRSSSAASRDGLPPPPVE